MDAGKEFKIGEVIRLLDEKIKTKEKFETIRYEFHYKRYDCQFLIKKSQNFGDYWADIGVEVPETNRMFVSGFLRKKTLEEMKKSLQDPENQKLIFPYVEMLANRVSMEE